ncbi:MAG TPA: fasciclin domain-containing protein [Acidimicrobiales bacterium]|nr:fasciclin domain-containing protein [Acidimicrobiales bacterium]
MLRSNMARILGLFLALVLIGAACSSDDDGGDTASSGEPTETTVADDSSEGSSDDTMATEDPASDVDSAEICDTDGLVEAVESGPEEGTLAGMTDDPVGTAASSNPVLTTLVTAVSEAELVDTLNSAEALTVFAPTDCAFAEFDQATLEAALADPTGLLTTVLGFHVIPERLSSDDLAGMDELTTFTGETLPIEVDGDTISLNDGQSTVQVPDIETANATVFLIDAVMVPPSAG